MSENHDWQNKKGHLAETEMIDQGRYNKEEQFQGSDQEGYSKENGNGNEPKEVSPLKTIFGTLVIIAVAWFLIAGFVNDVRYLQILGLSIAGLVVLSLIISMFRPGRVSFWSLWYLGDLLELLFYIIALIVRIAIEIAASR
ncbi:MAG: hypothetical protein ACTSRX_04745 [Promethearchaeota archaeon]